LKDKQPVRRYRAWINPLQFVSSVEPMPGMESTLPPVESVLDFTSPPDDPMTAEKAVRRYREISREKARMIAAPAIGRVLRKLVWPLRAAKASYMCGNWFATIAICDMVAEVVATMLYDIWLMQRARSGSKVSGQEPPTIAEFEKTAPAEKVEILRTWDVIDDGLEICFDVVNGRRARHRELWVHDRDTMAGDAVEAYHAAVFLAVRVIGQETENGQVVLSEDLAAYLNR
jgi:hypothetical protein